MAAVTLLLILLSSSSLRVWPIWPVWLLSSEQGWHLSAHPLSPWQGEQGSFLLQALGLIHGSLTSGSSRKETVGPWGCQASWLVTPTPRHKLMNLTCVHSLGGQQPSPCSVTAEIITFQGAKNRNHYLTHLVEFQAFFFFAMYTDYYKFFKSTLFKDLNLFLHIITGE